MLSICVAPRRFRGEFLGYESLLRDNELSKLKLSYGGGGGGDDGVEQTLVNEDTGELGILGNFFTDSTN